GPAATTRTTAPFQPPSASAFAGGRDPPNDSSSGAPVFAFAFARLTVRPPGACAKGTTFVATTIGDRASTRTSVPVAPVATSADASSGARRTAVSRNVTLSLPLLNSSPFFSGYKFDADLDAVAGRSTRFHAYSKSCSVTGFPSFQRAS